MNAIVIDIEANELYPLQTQTWTIAAKRVGSDKSEDKLLLNPFKIGKGATRKQLMEFMFKYENPIIVGHNFLGYDGWILWKDFDMSLHVGKDTICGKPVQFFDTLFASQFVYPDRLGGHSLKSWGDTLGNAKTDYRKVALELGIIQPNESEFCRWSPQMDLYCIQDLSVTEEVFEELYPIVEPAMQPFRLGQKNFFLMNAQAFTGFEFDQAKAANLKVQIEGMIGELRREVEPDLPKRKLKKAEESFYSIPAKPHVKGGGFSATMLNFIERHKATVINSDVIEINGEHIFIVPGTKVIDSLPMEIDDQKELKDFFLSQGWKPTLFNVKKDKSGKPVRDEKGKVIKTSPKVQENGKICPNLLELDGELPKKVVKFMSLRNRHSILTGWLENPRLKWDGRLPAGSSGIANTHRQKQHTIVNIPKAEEGVLLGKEFRSLFTVEEGNVLIGVDQAALEARCEGHWTYPFDNGERANILISKDIHSHNAKIFFPEELKEFDINSPDFSKDHPKFKPYRSLAKNGGYCLAYGGQGPKLATTLRKPEKDGKRLYDLYWSANPALKALKDKVEHDWEVIGEKKWITGVDGRRLYSRSKHSLVNLLFQSTGAIIVDYALALFDMKMGNLLLDKLGRPYYNYKGKQVKRVQYMHDEFGTEVRPEIADEIAKIMVWCMEEAGRRLKLNVPLIGEAKIGKNWKEVH